MKHIFLKIAFLLEAPQGSPACPSDKNGMKVKINTEHWCKYADRVVVVRYIDKKNIIIK